MFNNPNSQNYIHVLIASDVLNHIAMSSPHAQIYVKTLAEAIVPYVPLSNNFKPRFSFQPMTRSNAPMFGQHSTSGVFQPNGPFPGYPTGPSFADEQTYHDLHKQPSWMSPDWNPIATMSQWSQTAVPPAPESRMQYESGVPGSNKEPSVNKSEPPNANRSDLSAEQQELIETAYDNMGAYIGNLYSSSQENIHVKKLVALTWLSGMLSAVKGNGGLYNTYKDEIGQAAKGEWSDEFFDAVCTKTKVLPRVSFDMTKR